MKATDLTDNVLSNDRYEAFKKMIKGCDATFTATELRLGTDSVELRGCRVVHDASTEFVRHGSPPKKDSEAEWKHILDGCEHYGFRPK
jgi:hypothetical protein